MCDFDLFSKIQWCWIAINLCGQGTISLWIGCPIAIALVIEYGNPSHEKEQFAITFKGKSAYSIFYAIASHNQYPSCICMLGSNKVSHYGGLLNLPTHWNLICDNCIVIVMKIIATKVILPCTIKMFSLVQIFAKRFIS